MSGFAGFTNYTYRRENTDLVLKRMSDAIVNRGADIEAFYDDLYTHMAYRCRTPRNIAEKKKAMMLEKDEDEYMIVWDGALQNKEELQNILDIKNISLEDEAIVLELFHLYGEKVVEYLQGAFAFAIWNKKNRTLYMARDSLGIKPLFYLQMESNFIFASEIKAILEFPDVECAITEYGLANLFLKGLPGVAEKPFFKDIQELKACEYILYSPYEFKKEKYIPKEMQEWNMPIIQIVNKEIELTKEDITNIVKLKDIPSCIDEEVMLIRECEKVGEGINANDLFDTQKEWTGDIEQRMKIFSNSLSIDLKDFYEFQKKKGVEKQDYSTIERIANRFGYPVLLPKKDYSIKEESLREILKQILDDENSPILRLISAKDVKDMLPIMELDLMSYLIEINIWFYEYNIKIS